MKLFALLGAGLLAVGSFAAAPAEAQRGHGYGHDGGQYRGDHRGFRGDRGFRGHRGYRGGPGYRNGPRYRARTRTVCRTRRGYYGPVRTCYRVRR